MMTRQRRPIIRVPGHVLIAALLLTAAVRAEVQPAPIFGDHMVLQRDKPVPVWGTAEPGEELTVEFAGQTKTATADKDGNWKVVLDPMEASAEGRVLKIQVSGFSGQVSGEKDDAKKPDTRNLTPETLSLSDVLVGDVWLGSGQSNMDSLVGWPTYRSLVKTAREVADNPLVRYYGRPGYNYGKDYTYEGRTIPAPGEHDWVTLSPDNSLQCSAVLLFFAVRLQNELGVPIGILNRAVGATSCGYWLPAGSLTDDPAAETDQKHYREHADIAAKGIFYGIRRNYPPKVPDSQPGVPVPLRHGGGYAERILPLQPFAVRGLCWDQGEYGPGAPVEHPTALAALIRSWRRAWGEPADHWPVLVVQKPQGYGWTGTLELPPSFPDLPRFDQGPFQEHRWWGWDTYKGDGWSYWQVCEREPNVHIVNSMDLGHETHPLDKDRYGYRMADLALARVYGRQATNESPRFAAVAGNGDRLTVRFTHVGEGLKILTGKEVRGFRIAGEDRIFFDADAEITGKDTVAVSSKRVPKPVVVLYGVPVRPEIGSTMRQTTAGLGNLGSSQGLQAFPFRSLPWEPPTAEGMERAADRLIALLDDEAMRLEAARSLSEIGAKGEQAVAKLETLVRAEVPNYDALMGLLLVYATRDPTGSAAAKARQALMRRVVDVTLDDTKRARAAAWIRGVGAEGMDIVPDLRGAMMLDEGSAKSLQAAIDSIEKAAAQKKR